MITTQSHVEKYSAGRQGGEVPHLVVVGEVRKSCARCGTLRPIEAYSRHPTTWDGLGSTCRACLGQEESLAERVYVPPAPQRPAPVARKVPQRNLRTPELLKASHRRGAAAGAASKAMKRGERPPSAVVTDPPPGVLTDPWKAPSEKRWAYYGKGKL